MSIDNFDTERKIPREHVPEQVWRIIHMATIAGYQPKYPAPHNKAFIDPEYINEELLLMDRWFQVYKGLSMYIDPYKEGFKWSILKGSISFKRSTNVHKLTILARRDACEFMLETITNKAD